MQSFAPDASKHLHVLRQEWENCTACALGEYRVSARRGGNFVFGEGPTGRIMFIGSGPAKEDDEAGRPFMSDGGDLLRRVLKHLDLEGHSYLTNIVSCRSCSQSYDGEGQPKTWGDGSPAIQDRDPFGPEYEACRARLYEEIYIVDPIVIVTMGGVASEVVSKQHVAVMTKGGEPLKVQIPGAGFVPRLTEKKKEWYRKLRGTWVAPVDQNMVDYLCIPTYAPGFVAREEADKREDAPLRKFVQAIEVAKGVYTKYLTEVGTPEGY